MTTRGRGEPGLEDREILQRLRSGDESGMEALLGQYGPLLR